MRRALFAADGGPAVSDQLADDGTLFIGHSEMIRADEGVFAPLSIPQGFCYRKLSGVKKTT